MLAHLGDERNDKGVAHDEVTLTLRHPSVGPARRETVHAFALLRQQDTQLPCFRVGDCMGAAVLGALTGEHRTTGTVERVWERNGTFGKGVGVAGLGSALDGLGTLHVLPLFQILILDEEAFVDIAVDNDIAEQHRFLTVRDGFQREDFTVAQHTAVVESGSETVRYVNGVGIFIEIDGGHFLRVCDLRMHRECMGKEALLHQPDTTVLCVRRETRGHTLILLGGVLECKDEGTPSALDAAIVCGIDHTPFDSIAFFLQALQDDAEITATLGCG